MELEKTSNRVGNLPVLIEDDFEEVTRKLKTAASTRARTDAVKQLCEFEDSLVTLHLITALYDTAPEVRRAAVEALGQVGNHEALAALNELRTREQSALLPESV